MQSLKPEVAHLIEELNGFGEDTDKSLIASMYRHLSYWPTYLSLVRTMLVPLETSGQLHALTRSTRALAWSHGRALAQYLKPSTPPDTLQRALATCRRFVDHPISRMTGICSLIRTATDGNRSRQIGPNLISEDRIASEVTISAVQVDRAATGRP